MKEQKEDCAVCAWREDCQKKFSLSGRDMRCPDFALDVRVKKQSGEQERGTRVIYDRFFGFAEEPFGPTPNPFFFFLSRGHEEALAHLRFGIEEGRGFIMLTGEIGSGKTTVLRRLLGILDASVRTAVVLNPQVSPLELLTLIVRDFGLSCDAETIEGLMSCLNQFLIACHSRNEKAAVFVDEAQAMSEESLEFLRLLSNLEAASGKLLQIVLIGQPELRERVAGDWLRQLGQRITVRAHIGPLDRKTTGDYIRYRLRKAGGSIDFPEKAIRRIHRFSRGVPRLINAACDRTLLAAYAGGKRVIDADSVTAALKELAVLKGPGTMRIFRRPLIVASILLVMLLAALIVVPTARDSGRSRLFSGWGQSEQSSRRLFLTSDGQVMASSARETKDAALFTLLRQWGAAGFDLSADAADSAAGLGYQTSALGRDWERLRRANLPGLIRMVDGRGERWLVLLWVVGDAAVLFDPLEGRKLVPFQGVRKTAAEIVIIWKNKYNSRSSRAEALRDLIQSDPEAKRTAQPERAVEEALSRLQRNNGLPQSGRFDDETQLMLSRDSSTPELYPDEIRKGGRNER